MTDEQSRKHVVVDAAIHKKMKLIAVENDIDLQDLIHSALELFINKCETEGTTHDHTN